jgi:hypothetical protein
MRGAAFGWLIVFAIDPVYTGFRYELTLLPAVAVGLCSLLEHVGRRYAHQRSASAPAIAAAAPGIDLYSRQAVAGAAGIDLSSANVRRADRRGR